MPALQNPLAHTVPHAPQFLASVCTLAQVIPQRARPGLQLTTHCPAEQLATPEPLTVHTLPQPPQLFISICSLTHVPPQRAKPGLQLTTHCPAAQLTAAAFESFGSHTLPQLPQLSGSDVMSAHALLQHVEALPPQTAPHAPQLFGSLVVSTQAPTQQATGGLAPFFWALPPMTAERSHVAPTFSHAPLALHNWGC
jgi:hypothetical protein